MNFRRLLAVGVLFTMPATYPILMAQTSQNKIAVLSGPSDSLRVSNATQIPGRTLQPGVYSIRIVDRLSDRMILRIEQKGGEQTTFLALPKGTLAANANPGPIMLATQVDGKAALQGFSFTDGTVAEFVYPKSEAVALAKANDTKIVAIDPASEGRVAEPALSKDDMKMVTLWMLTPTQVGPDSQAPGVTAARYQQVAGIQAPRPPRPRMAVLPHTAGMMPTLWLAALLSLSGASFLTWRRVSSQAR